MNPEVLQDVCYTPEWPDERFGKTHREVKRLVDSLLESSALPNARSVNRGSDVAGLLKLCAEPKGKSEVLRQFTKRTTTRFRTVTTLFALMDDEGEAGVPLKKSSSITAQLLRLIIEVPKMGLAVGAYLDDNRAVCGAAGIRYLIKTFPVSIQAIPNLKPRLIDYVDRLSTSLSVSDPKTEIQEWSIEGHRRTVGHTLRLLELMLKTRVTRLSHLKPKTLQFIMKNCDVELAPMAVVRSFVGPASPTFPADVLFTILVDAVTSSISPGDTARCQGRSLAFSALAVMHRYRQSRGENDTLLRIVIEVWFLMLVPKPHQRIWDITNVMPHDDAYTILSYYSPVSFVPILRFKFAAAIMADSYGILEPLIALIVDRMAEPDPYWPTMLSALIEAGLIDYLMRIANLSLPPQEHALFRVVQGAKRDAVTGVLRCFEQMSVRDVSHIKWRIFSLLKQLMDDEFQPLAVQDLAKAALDTWDKNMDGFRPIEPAN
ncbi:hypothetical protein FRB97_009092 [Tulasnella sp. 331]|nr:hypothetical protein FRB97_009092 [Tulasnella sp. 331]